MMKERIVLVGTGQHFNVVLYNLEAQGKYEVACALDSDLRKKGCEIQGIQVAGDYSDLDAIQERFATNKFFISFGDMKRRKEVFNYFISKGWESVNIIHPKAVVSEGTKLGSGVLIECGCLIAPNPIIGSNVVINMGSQVNHDNVIEDHVFIASGVILSGGVTIQENSLLDDGVIVSIGRKVGANSIVGAGAVVTNNIESNKVAYGVPAKVIRDNL